MAAAGVEMFARYAYPPNELGYCGPDDASVLLDRASPEERLAAHARQFEGAWPYLEIIAEAARIPDPLDVRVVEAYWIGNELLDVVDAEGLVERLQQRFTGQAGASWVPGRPHHSFHVFAVYPWVGLLSRDAAGAVPLAVLEQCRIRWGEVVAVDGREARVRSQPLVLDEGRLALGPVREETVAWSVEAGSLLGPASEEPTGEPPVAVGDRVAMHWGWICDVLSSLQVAQLQLRTADQLRRTNAALQVAGGR